VSAATLRARLAARWQALDERRLIRRLQSPSGVDLSSNDYLGLSRHPRIASAMADAVLREGCGSTGSRLLRGHRDVFDDAERAFAAFKGVERSLYFSSGYLANLAVLTTFAEPGDVILSDRLNHASLRDGARLSQARRAMFPHGNVRALSKLIASTQGSGQTFVVVESLFSMDGDIAPLGDYAAVCRETGALLIVDEAHAVGMYGRRGSGLIEELGVDADAFVSINTAGKALGVSGAFVAGPAWAIDHLIQRARPFVFSTAAPPSVAAALIASLSVIADEPERRRDLRARASQLRAALIERGVDVAAGDSPVIPVILGGSEHALAVAGAVQARGFDVRAIRPPTVPDGTARLRISVNLALTDAAAGAFVDALAACLQETSTCPAVSS